VWFRTKITYIAVPMLKVRNTTMIATIVPNELDPSAVSSPAPAAAATLPSANLSSPGATGVVPALMLSPPPQSPHGHPPSHQPLISEAPYTKKGWNHG
jgi:hypothetical protein